MNITIKTDDKDMALLDGFATATGWTDKLSVTKGEWFQRKVSEWISQRAKMGFALNATVASKTQYVSAVQTARQQADVAIPDPVVTAGAITVP